MMYSENDYVEGRKNHNYEMQGFFSCSFYPPSNAVFIKKMNYRRKKLGLGRNSIFSLALGLRDSVKFY